MLPLWGISMTAFLFSGAALFGFFLMFSEEEYPVRQLGFTIFCTSLVGIFAIWILT